MGDAVRRSAKDLRAWVIDQQLDLTCTDEWHVAGERFLASEAVGGARVPQ